MKADSVNVRALCHAYDLGKAEGIEKGRAEAIEEILSDIRTDFSECSYVADYLEQILKEQKNES